MSVVYIFTIILFMYVFLSFLSFAIDMLARLTWGILYLGPLNKIKVREPFDNQSDTGMATQWPMGVSYFYFCCCDEILLRKKGFILAYGSRLQSVAVGKSRQGGEAASHIYSRQRGENSRTLTSPSPLLHSAGPNSRQGATHISGGASDLNPVKEVGLQRWPSGEGSLCL